jgi:GNAT superfamily N-acetyltransferase
MSNQLHIRPVKADEMPDVKELVLRIAHEMMEPETPYEQLKNQWNEWGVFNDLDDVEASYISQGGAFFISECDGQIVGTGAFLRYEAPGYCELKRIALKPAYRGRGFGYAMIRALMHEARAMGYQRMILWTNRQKLTRAIALYLRMGFVEVQHEGADEDEIWLERELGEP